MGSHFKRHPAGTPVRHAITSGGFSIKGDAVRTVDAMINTADARRPALRLTLGSTAYGSISKALTDPHVHKAAVISTSR